MPFGGLFDDGLPRGRTPQLRVGGSAGAAAAASAGQGSQWRPYVGRRCPCATTNQRLGISAVASAPASHQRSLDSMPRRRHDSMSKDLLTLWCEPLGPVSAPRRVHGEERQIDAVVDASLRGPKAEARRRALGLLGRMGQGLAAFEAFRNPCTAHEVRAAIVKLVELHDELRRRARRRRTSVAEVPLPHLWALTPTLSDGLAAGFRALPREGFPPGCFGLADELGVTLVALAELPETPETLWLRILGRGKVQRRAFDELLRLPANHPLRGGTWRRVLRWRTEAESAANPSEADRELIMNSERLLQQWERRLRREGKVEGKAEGKAEGLRVAVLDLCEAFGIALGATERARLEAMALDELEALRQALKSTKRWPAARGR
jgi:hypothetical protein